MALGILLVVIAIVYAVTSRTEPLKIIYSGVALIVIGVVFLITVNIALSQGFASMSSTRENIAYVALLSALITLPSGVIMTIVGIIVNQKRKK